LRDGDGDVFMDRRWLAVVESTVGAPVSAYRYLLVFGRDGRPALGACLIETTLDTALLSGGWLRRFVQGLRGVVPGALKLRTLQVGSPVHGGQSQLRIAADQEPGPLLRRLVEVLNSMARAMQAHLIIVAEHPDEDLLRLAPLESLGFVRGPSLPMNRFQGSACSIDEFAATLRSHYRYKLRRSQRRFAESGLRARTLEGRAILPVYSAEMHRLYELVGERAEVRTDLLPRAFFVELVRRMPRNVALHVVDDGPTPIAFALTLFDAENCRNLYIGYDCEREDQADLYFNLMLQQLDFALSRRTKRVVLGQTADEFKSRIGCAPEALSVYVKPQQRSLVLALRLFRRWLFKPPAAALPRHLYRDD
jgi:predicted N-acyltransferase